MTDGIVPDDRPLAMSKDPGAVSSPRLAKTAKSLVTRFGRRFRNDA